MSYTLMRFEIKNSSISEAIVVITIVLLISVFPLFPTNWIICLWGPMIALTIVSWFRHWQTAFPIGIFCSVVLSLVLIGLPFSQIWLGIGLLFYIAVTKIVHRFNENLCWLKAGTFSHDVYGLVIGSGVLAAIALIIWFIVFQPNINDLIEKFLPKWNMVYLILGGILFSMVNAAVEEGAYRGVIMHALDMTLGAGKTSLVLQAISFGIFHINGFPRGWIGVLLASIFGVLLGLTRQKANGMLAPLITHIFVDIVIVVIVTAFAQTA